MAIAALAVGGMALNAVGSIGEGQAEYEAQQFNSRNALNNARLAREQAQDDARRQRIGADKQLGDIRSNYAASGVVSSEGSALDVLQESSAAAELDNLMIKHQGEMRAYGHEQEAKFGQMRGGAARTRGYMNAAGGALSGASRVLGMF